MSRKQIKASWVDYNEFWLNNKYYRTILLFCLLRFHISLASQNESDTVHMDKTSCMAAFLKKFLYYDIKMLNAQIDFKKFKSLRHNSQIFETWLIINNNLQMNCTVTPRIPYHPEYWLRIIWTLTKHIMKINRLGKAIVSWTVSIFASF